MFRASDNASRPLCIPVRYSRREVAFVNVKKESSDRFGGQRGEYRVTGNAWIVCCRIIYCMLRSTRDHVSPRALYLMAYTYKKRFGRAALASMIGSRAIRTQRGRPPFTPALASLRVLRQPPRPARSASIISQLSALRFDDRLARSWFPWSRRKSRISYPRCGARRSNSAVRTRGETVREPT